MNKEDLKVQLLKIDKWCSNKKAELLTAYCDEHNPYKIGDIVYYSGGSIRIQRISYYLNTTDPCCIYRGIVLKKDGTPKKGNPVGEVYQYHVRNKREGA